MIVKGEYLQSITIAKTGGGKGAGKKDKGKSGEGKPEKGEGEGAEGEGKPGEGEGEGGAGKPGAGGESKPGKGKGKVGEASGEAIVDPTTGEPIDDATAAEIMKQAEEELDAIKNADEGLKSCGTRSSSKDVAPELDDYDYANAQKAADEMVEEAFKKAPKDNPLRVGGGKGGAKVEGAKEREVVTYLVPRKPDPPDWLQHVYGLLGRKYTKTKMRGGFDVRESFISPLVSKGGGLRIYKDKPKMPKRKFYVYVLADCSGSMVDRSTGGTLAKLLSVVPMLADKFDGEVWWCSAGLMSITVAEAQRLGIPADHTDDSGKRVLAKSDLKEFKDADAKQISKIVMRDASWGGSYGGGSNHDVAYVEFAKFQQKMLEEHQTEIAVIALTDFAQDDEPLYPKNMIVVTRPDEARALNKKGDDYFPRFQKFKNDPDNNIHVVDWGKLTQRNFEKADRGDELSDDDWDDVGY